jgi:hypothetical protein
MPHSLHVSKEEDGETSYDGPERRAISLIMPSMTEAQLEDLATRAAEKAIARITTGVYTSVGRAVMEKLVWAVGVGVVGLIIWIQTKGSFKL